MNEQKQDAARPLAFELARELKQDELAAIAGGYTPFWTLGDIGPPNQPRWYDHHH